MDPKWTHDCEDCKYIGSMHHERNLLDWYTCGETVIARHGDDGPEYCSLPHYVVNSDAYLVSRDIDVNRGVNSMFALARFMLQNWTALR